MDIVGRLNRVIVADYMKSKDCTVEEASLVIGQHPIEWMLRQAEKRLVAGTEPKLMADLISATYILPAFLIQDGKTEEDIRRGDY